MTKFFLDELTNRWLKSGIVEGDTILLHSNIKRLLLEFKEKKMEPNLDIIIKSFLNSIGKDGTLIMPLFNFGFTRGDTFDINSTVSRMGILTEFFRVNYNIIRTGHPIYSFAVYGKNSKHFQNIDNYSGYSEDSPFGILKRLDGKIAVLDLDDQHSMTFYHHIEEINKVEWRYFKLFKGMYIDKNFIQSEKEYSLFVRKIDLGITTHVNPAGELLWKEGLYKGDKPLKRSGLRTINSKNLFDYISEIIISGKAENILYKVS